MKEKNKTKKEFNLKKEIDYIGRFSQRRDKKELIIEQDDREPEMQLDSDLNGLNLTFERKRLKVGDYICGNLIVERKQIDDLCSSILDGRIERQVENMKASDKECFVIIVGNLKDRTVGINENCVLGKAVSLVVKHDMKVLWCEDDFQFVWLLRNLVEKIELKGGDGK